MIIALTIFIISLTVASLILWNKNVELEYGRSVICFGTMKTDEKVSGVLNKGVSTVKHFTLRSAQTVARKFIVYVEKAFMQAFHYISKKFTIAGDVLTGHNIPKNRGSVSFFLKNIEEHKKTISDRS